MAISWTNNDVTATINMPNPLGEVILSTSSKNITIPAIQAKATGSYLMTPYFLGLGRSYTYGSGWYDYGNGLQVKYGATVLKNYIRAQSASAVNNNVYVNLSYTATPTILLTTSNFFNSTNPNDRSVSLSIVAPNGSQLNTYNSASQGGATCINSAEKTLSTITLTLDVPPTATISAISYDTGFVYAGLTTASVTVSNTSAKYGGNISSVEFAIGSQSATLSGDGTLSIALANPGTFTPTVKITDSRGQVKTYSLDPITVNTYTAPTVSFDVKRTDSNGDPDDEGTYCLIEATLTFSDVVADAVAPSVVITDENGTSSTPVVTWYTDNTLQTTVTWANVSSGDTVYGLFSGVNVNYSYSVSVRPRDSQGTGTAITQTLSSAFYTVDFLAGGHGIAFGKPASAVGFECAMATTFESTLEIDGDLTCNNDVLIDLPDYQTSGTTDYDIYTGIVALGWDSEVIV